MNPTGFPGTAQPNPRFVDDPPGEPGMDAHAIASALWARRMPIALWSAGGAVLLAVISLLLPPVYVASTSLLEAPKQGGGSTLDQLGISAQLMGIGGGGGASNALTYPDILRSRRLLDGLLASRFPTRQGRPVRLDDYLKPGRPSPQRTDLAMRELGKRLDISLDRRTNLLRLSVSDRDPVLAAAVANAATTALQDLVMHAMMTQAGANRRFIESRLETTRAELARSEAALESFRELNRHVDGSPRLSLEQARLARDLRTREEVVVALTREYEMARVDENRDVPVLNVLDASQPPAFRSSPRRGMLTAAGLLLGLALGIARVWPRRSEAIPLERAEAA